MNSKSTSFIGSQEIDFKKLEPAFWKDYLEPEVYNICIKGGTERGFSGTYDKLCEEGIYCCNCCGGDFPVFSSQAKYNSGTGWPSFWAPIAETSLTLTKEEEQLFSIFGPRTEVSCSRCGAHLGHVFDDGPHEKTGMRFCINSLALRFVAAGQKATSDFLTKDCKLLSGLAKA